MLNAASKIFYCKKLYLVMIGNETVLAEIFFLYLRIF